MEPRKEKLHNSSPAVDTPFILSSSLPTNFVQFSSSALIPLGSSSAFGGIFSIPVVSHQLVSPIQQKQHLPMQSEPLLLLPASALSFSAHSNFVVSTPPHSSANLSPPLLHSQQLHLNAAQIPLLLKSSNSSLQVDQAFTAQQMNQQFIVLPVGGGNGNYTPVLDQTAQSRAISDHKNVLGSESQSGDRTNYSHSKKGSTHLLADKCESMKTKRKIRDLHTKTTPTTKSDSSTDSSTLDDSNSELNKVDIAQIISSIPSGWKVVGVTGLNQLALGEIMPLSQASPSLLDVSLNTSTAEVNSQVKCEVSLVTEEITPHDQPSLVSVNLNTASQPVASETVFDKWPAKELTCSVKMDDIPCTHVISIKTECIEGSEESLGNGADGLDFEHLNDEQQNLARTSDSQTGLCCSKLETNIQAEKSSRKASMESCSTSENDFPLQEPKIKPSDSPSAQSLFSDSKWTIVGITSLSPLPPTSTVTASQVGTLALGEGSNLSVNTSSESNAVMLNIPVCSSTVSHVNEDKNINISNTNILHQARDSPPVSLILNDGNKSSSDIDLYTKTKPEDIKWTIVGVMGSPVPNSAALNPCISSGSEFLRNSHPVTSCPLSSTTLENVMNSQLLSILPPLSNTATSPALLLASSSPDQISPNTQSKRQTKSQDTAKKSPKSKVSTNKDDPKQDHCGPHSENQWKIVGVTQFGIPPAAASPIVSVSQLNPISPVMSMPLLIPTSSGPLFSNLTAEATSIVTQTTGTTSTSLLSSYPTLPSLFPQQAMSFPVLNLNGTSCNSSMTLSSPSSLLGAASPVNIHTMQDLAQQHNLNQLIQNQLTACHNPISMLTMNESNQLTACHNPISMLTMNESNQWNVVGVVANNQVSLLNQSQANPPVSNAVSTESNPNTQDTVSHASVTSTQNIKPKRNHSNNDGRKIMKSAPANKSVTIRQSLASRREDSGGKRYHSKCKDIVNKHQRESTKIKKNTVSNLLRIKRMQQGTHENGSSEDGDQSFEEYQDFTDTSYEVPPKKTKTRSLRSYAGNRKIFTRTQNKAVDEKISLRSRTQIPVLSSKSDDDDDDDDDKAEQILPTNSKMIDERVADAAIPVIEAQNDDKYTGVIVDAHSSSRRRKLKVPRKLVADLDYHPFDSSSDSN